MTTRLTQAAFARHIGVTRAYVTRLKQADRLAMDGNLVLVEASIARIAHTAGTRDDVVARHAEARQAAGKPPAPSANGGPGAAIAAADGPPAQPEAASPPAAPESAPADMGAAGEPGIITLSALDQAREAKILAESRRVQALANREELELARARGEVIAREECEIAFKSVGAAIRGLVEVMPDQLAPLVTPAATLDDCHAILAQYGRDLLVRFGEEMERQRAAMGRAA